MEAVDIRWAYTEEGGPGEDDEMHSYYTGGYYAWDVDAHPVGVGWDIQDLRYRFTAGLTIRNYNTFSEGNLVLSNDHWYFRIHEGYVEGVSSADGLYALIHVRDCELVTWEELPEDVQMDIHSIREDVSAYRRRWRHQNIPSLTTNRWGQKRYPKGSLLVTIHTNELVYSQMNEEGYPVDYERLQILSRTETQLTCQPTANYWAQWRNRDKAGIRLNQLVNAKLIPKKDIDGQWTIVWTEDPENERRGLIQYSREVLQGGRR